MLAVVRESAAVGPLQSYLLQYKRSVLANPNAAGLDGLAPFNGFGTIGGTPPFNGLNGGTTSSNVPFDYGDYGHGFGAYSPALSAASTYGFGDLSPLDHGRAFVPANFLQQFAGASLYGPGFDATGYPFAGAAQYKFAQPPQPGLLPQVYQQQSSTGNGGQNVQTVQQHKTAPPNAVQGNAQSGSVVYSDEPKTTNGRASAPQSVPPLSSDGGKQSRLLVSNAADYAPSARTRYPAQQEMPGPTFRTVASDSAAGAESTPTRLQIPSSSYRQAVPETGITASSQSAYAPGTAETPNLFLELTPPAYSDPSSYDYSKSPSPSSYIDFGSVLSGSDSNQQVSNKYPVPGSNSNSPVGAGAYRDTYPAAGPASSGGFSTSPSSSSYLVPSISYSLPGHTYTGRTEPNAGGGHYGSSGVTGAENSPKTESVPNGNFASNHLYSETDSSGPTETGPVSGGSNAGSNSFSNAYYKVPVDIPASDAGGASASYQSNPTSANTYSESNSIQSSSYNTAGNPYGNSKLVLASNVYGDSNSISSNKHESSNFAGRLDKSPLNYYPSPNVYTNKNVEIKT